jgi:hypothetical protein
MVLPSVTAESKGPPTSNRQTKLVLQPLDQQWQPSTHQYYPAITTISSEQRPNGDDRVYVETFLIDAVSAPNKKGWRVSYDNPEDFDSRVQASKNHPLVLFQTPHPTKDGEMIFDHPVAPITSLEAAADPLRATIEFQKKYTIGYARHFKKVKDGIWHAVYEITNAKAKKFFQKAKEKGLKLFTSPHIVRPASEPDRKNIREWALIHNAIVSNPAHNEAIASIKDVKAVSSRYPVDFNSLFASLDTPDDDDLDAGYLLEIYTNQLAITSHDNNSEKLNNMPETASINATLTPQEANLTSPQLNTATTFNPITNQTDETKIPQSSGPKEVQQTAENQQPQEQTQEQKQQASELEKLKAQIETLNKQNQDLQQKYAQDTRKAQIEKLFAPVVGQLYADPKTGLLNEKEYNAEVSRLVKTNHNYDEISELIQARYVLAQYQNAKNSINTQEKASFTSQETESASIPYTKMSTGATTSTANNNVDTIGLAVLRKIQGGLF